MVIGNEFAYEFSVLGGDEGSVVIPNRDRRKCACVATVNNVSQEILYCF
jgi:hypothetical protein